MPQFNAEDQDKMLNVAENMPWVLQATKCGPGLRLVEDNGFNDDVVFGGLTRKFGWYYDCTLWTSDEMNKVHIIMPITEVNNE